MFPDNNVFSYLKWRGDIQLETAAFNEVDALVLSVFSYLNLPGIVSQQQDEISLQAAAQKYFAPRYPQADHPYYRRLLNLMAHASRFKKARLSYFVNKITTKSQFSAIKIRLEDGTNFIAFRGTDDSIVGWKEDFEISFQTTHAQKEACRYLNKIMRESQDQDEQFILGGHSKGGNLAEYAALNIEPQFRDRIKKIYTFDSPGIAQEVDTQIPHKYLKERMVRFVPDFSIVGRLFEPQDIPATIISSSRKGLSQHDAFSWEITGSHFVTRNHANPQARLYNQLIHDWIGNATLAERESLTNDLFSSLAASGSSKITELNKYGFGSFGAILLSLTGSSRRTHFVLDSLLRAIWQALKNQRIIQRLFTIDSIAGWIMLIMGIITLTTPQYSLRSFGALVALAGIGYSSNQILAAAESKLQKRQKRFFIISWLLVFALSVALISNNRLLIFLAHYFLGTFLIIYSYVRLRQIILRQVKGIFRKIIVAVEALVSFALGVTIIVNPRSFNRTSMIVAGILLIIYGFFKLIAEIFGQRKTMPRQHRLKKKKSK